MTVSLKNLINCKESYLKNPEIQREDEEQLSIEELSEIAEKLEEAVEDYTQK